MSIPTGDNLVNESNADVIESGAKSSFRKGDIGPSTGSLFQGTQLTERRLGYVIGGWPAIAESAENEGKISFPNDFRRSFVEPQEFDSIHIATGFEMNSS